VKASRRTTLGECCEIVSGATPSTTNPIYWDGDIEWATPKDLSELNDKYISRTGRRITKEGLESCAAVVLPPHSVLFSSRAPIGYVAINGVPMATNQGFKNFVPRTNEVTSSFLYHWLRAHKDYLESLGNGATFKEVSKAVVSRIEIDLPPLSVQRRIADILDKADAIHRRRDASIPLADELLRSAFIDMFGDPLTNPKNWRRDTLGNLLTLSSGDFLPARQMDARGPFAVYGGNGVNGRHSAYMFKESVLTIGRVGVYCGVIHRTEPRSWVTDNALYVATFSDALDITYLEHALRLANLNQYASQAAQPLISAGRIAPVEILVPSKDAQARFAQSVKVQTSLRESMQRSLSESAALFQTLQAAAFSQEKQTTC
jgi:type I restriction enzyme, S subunit